jgi:transposase-like protein
MALYGCKKCGRSFEELELWGRVEFHGDHWKCTSCNEDITKDLNQWFKEVNELGNLLWQPLTSENDL